MMRKKLTTGNKRQTNTHGIIRVNDKIYHNVYQKHRLRCPKSLKKLAIFNTRTNIYILNPPFSFPFEMCEITCETLAL